MTSILTLTPIGLPEEDQLPGVSQVAKAGTKGGIIPQQVKGIILKRMAIQVECMTQRRVDYFIDRYLDLPI